MYIWNRVNSNQTPVPWGTIFFKGFVGKQWYIQREDFCRLEIRVCTLNTFLRNSRSNGPAFCISGCIKLANSKPKHRLHFQIHVKPQVLSLIQYGLFKILGQVRLEEEIQFVRHIDNSSNHDSCIKETRNNSCQTNTCPPFCWRCSYSSVTTAELFPAEPNSSLTMWNW